MAVLQPGALPQGDLRGDLGRADRACSSRSSCRSCWSSNVPANAMVRVLEPGMVAFTLAATAVLLWASRRFFQHALRSYRSASS